MSMIADRRRGISEPLIGSYDPDDCRFLLKELSDEFQSIENKERLIQTGRLHYSQLIHEEKAPSKEYTQLFLELTELHQDRLAAEILGLAQYIANQWHGEITLVSLARAGTPIGVLLQRALRDVLNRQSCHYSISIIRDRGIDEVALDFLLAQRHHPNSIHFIDGWTAKGVITRELKSAISAYNQSRGVKISDCLFVVSDIGGSADIAATTADYAIPSGLMNSTVSGLVSRTILNDRIGPGDFHGCVIYSKLAAYDLSNWFIDRITQRFVRVKPVSVVVGDQETRTIRTSDFLYQIMKEHRVSDINRIKPGIAEATRVLLRRIPDYLMVRSADHKDVMHLLRLAEEKNVPTAIIPDMPFGACAIIKDILIHSAIPAVTLPGL